MGSRDKSQKSTLPINILFFDIETTNLSANFGRILACAFKWAGDDKPFVLSQVEPRINMTPREKRAALKVYRAQPWDDSELLKSIRQQIEAADIIVSYNGRMFDLPFIRTRLAVHKLPELHVKKHVDLLPTVKYGLRMTSNKLDTVAKFFGLSHQKTEVLGEYWVKAATGEINSMKYIVEHAELDVLVLEDLLRVVKDQVRAIKTDW